MAQYDIVFYKNDPESGVSLSEFWLSKPAGSNYALSQNPNTGLLYWQLFEPAFTKNNAFNKSFGAVADTVCQGNDSRLSDARTPLAHAHTFDSITSKPTTLAGYGITDGSSLALGALASNAYRGDYGTIAYNHSQVAHAPSNANYYVHPANHPASVITQDASNRFVSDTEKTTWNAKAATSVATTLANGLMSSTDKTKLDGVAASANNYTHPANHAPSIITQDASNRFVTDTEKATWNGKQANLGFTPYNATNPSGYIALSAVTDSVVTAKVLTGYVAGTNTALAATDTILAAMGKIQGQITARSGTVTGVTGTAPVVSSGGTAPVISMAAATASVNGYMTSTYAAKLDGIAASANNYSHPANHPASIITQDASNRFVTDTEKATWNGKGTSNLALGTTSATAYRGDYGNTAYSWANTAYNHSQATHAPSNAQVNADITKAEIEAKLTGAITTHTHDYVANSRISYGTADPSGGSDGDVYFQYE